MIFAKLTSTFFVHVLNWNFFQILLKCRRATERKRELKVWSDKITSDDIILVHHLARCIPYQVCCYSNSEPSINRSFYKKNRSLRTRAMYLVINLTIADMFVGGFSHFSLFVTLLYLCDIVQFPHLTLELILTTGFLFVWFPLTSLTNIAVISLDQMHATIRPYSALRHPLIRKWVYGVTIAGFVWVLPAMFIIIILRIEYLTKVLYLAYLVDLQSFHVVAWGTQRLVSVK